LLGILPKPLDQSYGTHKSPQIAVIIEKDCIGCVKCIAACPVDAIIGASKMLHTVVAEECTGCELCLPPCPVNCIEIRPAPGSLLADQKLRRTQLSKRRYEARLIRQQKHLEAQQERANKQKALLLKLKMGQTANAPKG
jgi:Na+-translocating ferredoxin:NAD+ oxidoreductase subunit B